MPAECTWVYACKQFFGKPESGDASFDIPPGYNFIVWTELWFAFRKAPHQRPAWPWSSSVSDESKLLAPSAAVTVEVSASPASHETNVLLARLDDVEDLDFLLEEIENKIAPLALA